MGIIEMASGNSVWRGLDYHEQKKVLSWKKSDEGLYDGIVAGSGGVNYSVHLDINHPRSSTCNCAFADGRKVVCKYMVAIYFTSDTKRVTAFHKQVEQWEKQAELERERELEDLKKSIKKLSKAELVERLYDAMLELEERRNSRW